MSIIDQLMETYSDAMVRSQVETLALGVGVVVSTSGALVDVLEGFREQLERHLAGLIDRDVGQLAQLLYRIDVPEPKVDAIFTSCALSEVSGALADLILARLQQTLAQWVRFEQGAMTWASAAEDDGGNDNGKYDDCSDDDADARTGST